MLTYLLNELYQSQKREQPQPKIIEIKKLIFRNCAPFIDCVSEINKTQVDNAKDIDVVISMYHLIEHSDNY